MVEESWDQLVSDFQLLCILKRQGKLEASHRILHQELPKTIAAWSRCNPKDTAAKKCELETMFTTEKQRVDDLWLINRINAVQWQDELLPALRNAVGQEVGRVVGQRFIELEIQQATALTTEAHYQRRVAFDDVAGVIDLVQAEQRRPRTANP